MKFTILTAGSRGDIQPYIALGLGLQSAGYQVKLAAFENFKYLVEQYGLEFHAIKANIRDIVNSEIGLRTAEAGRVPLLNLLNGISLAKQVLPSVATGFWNACHDTDVIINSSPILGCEIAQLLRKKYIEATIYPGLSTDYPNPFFQIELPLGKSYNVFTHKFFASARSCLLRREINGSLALLDPDFRNQQFVRKNDVATVYGFSPRLISRPANWDQHLQITGFWFLDHPAQWSPPTDLVDFINDGDPPVYIGFGSMPIRNKAKIAEIILETVSRSDHRAIIGRGWGNLCDSAGTRKIYVVDDVPHDWLFPRISAVVCHAGAGTIAASIRAGKPIVSIPFFADQPFWAKRVHRMGIGLAPIHRGQLSSRLLRRAINTAVTNPVVRQRAHDFSQRIFLERGVESAVGWIRNWCH